MKTKLKPFALLASGFLAGILFCIVILLLLASRYAEMKEHGNLVVTKYPEFLNTVTFDNDIVAIQVVDFTYDRDVPFEPNILVVCKDTDYGSFWGTSKQGKFLFSYHEKGRNSMPELLNDVHNDFPSMKATAPLAPQE